MEQQTIKKENPLGYEKISTLIRQFSIPSIISMVVSAVYNMVDQVFIGHAIGDVGIAATNVAFPLTTISMALALLFGVGGASRFNLKLGAGEPGKASFAAGNALTMSAISGTVLGVITLLFTSPLLVAFGASEEVLPYAEAYTRIIAIGLPFATFSTTASHMIRADGSPRYSMMFMVAGALFNLIFDPIFLFVFDMGIEGIALATTLGQVLTTALALIYLNKRFKSTELKRVHLKPQGAVVKTLATLGIASFFNQIAMTIVQIVLNNTLRHYGALSPYGAVIPLAAVGSISKVSMLFMSVIIGIAQGCQPINSFNYGAKNYDRVKKTYKTAITYASIAAVISFLIFQIFPGFIIGIFGESDPLYMEFGIRMMRIYLFGTFLNGFQPVTANFFTSIGKARRGILISLTRQVLFLLPLIIVLPLFMGIDGVAFAGPIADAMAALVAVLIVRQEFKIMGTEPGE